MDFFDDQEVFNVPEKPELVFSQIAHEGQEKLMLVISSTEQTESGIALLHKIVAAVGLDPIEEVTMLLIDDNEHYLFHQLIKASKANFIILFGNFTNSIKTQFHASPFRWFELGGRQIIYVDSIVTLTDDQSKKRLLWNALQQKFKN